jgi:hypothetical protein
MHGKEGIQHEDQVVEEDIRSLFEVLKRRVWGENLVCDDPVFGHLTTQRLKGRGRPVGDPPIFEWFADPIYVPGARFEKIEQVVVHAGRNGPGAEHHQAWLQLLKSYEAFQETLEHKVFENYLWHREMLLEECRAEYGDEDLSRYKSWPQYANAEEAFASRCFDIWWLDVYHDHLEFYVFNDWDEEHNLRVWVRGGQFAEIAQE